MRPARCLQVTAADTELDQDIPLAILAVHDEGAGLLSNGRQLLERDTCAVRRADDDIADRLDVLAELGKKADDEVEPALALVDLGDGLPADGGLHDIVDVIDLQPIARILHG